MIKSSTRSVKDSVAGQFLTLTTCFKVLLIIVNAFENVTLATHCNITAGQIVHYGTSTVGKGLNLNGILFESSRIYSTNSFKFR